jgi:hypothetical protein
MPLARPIGQTGAYQLFTDANVTTWLQTYGFMGAAPAAPAVGGGIEFEDRAGVEFEDREGVGFEDRET